MNRKLDRLLLVQPMDPLFKEQNPFPQYRLACLAAVVEDEVEVKIADATDKDIPWILRELEVFDPQWVGLTIPFMFLTPTVLEICQAIKTRYGRAVKIIVGGRSATSISEQILACGADAVVRGEGEITLREIVQKGSFEEVCGVSHWFNGDIRRNPPRPLISNLDDLPMPAYHLIDMGSADVHELETSRGCPARCTFCETYGVFGGTWRAKSPERVVQELKMLVNRYGEPGLALLEDDNIGVDMKRLERICRLLIEEGYKVPIQLQLRADDITRNPDIVPLLAEAGTRIVIVGLESASQETLNKVRKGTKLSQIFQASELLRQNGIHLLGSYIIGLPHETAEMAEQSIRLAIDTADSLGLCMFTPYPGTDLYEQCKRNGLLLTDDWGKYNQYNQVVKTTEWPQVNFEEVRDRLARLFYGRADWIKSHFPVHPGRAIWAKFARGFSLTYTQDYVLNALDDWAEVIEGYRFVANEFLHSLWGNYGVRARLATESLTMDIEIQEGRLQPLRSADGQVGFTLRASDKIMNQVFRLMTQDVLSALIEGKLEIDAAWPASAAFIRWCDSFQEIVDAQATKLAPDNPTCLPALNDAIARLPEPKPNWTTRNGRYLLQTEGGDLVFGLRSGKVDTFRLRGQEKLHRIQCKISLDPSAVMALTSGDFGPLLATLSASAA